MLGAPPEDRDRFREWSDELALVAFGAGGDARPDRHERALRGLEEMAEYFRGLVAQRRRAPAADMLSAMIAGDTPAGGTTDEGLTDDELVGMCALLLFAGHETTTNAIANAVRLLTADPELRDRVSDDPALLNPAVEEALRLAGPIKVLVRWVVADHELRGRTIRAGERVYLLLPGANRDPARFPDPDTVDLARERATHVAFGRGVHACIGAQLARIETRIAVGTLLRRLPGLRVDGDPAWLPTLASRAQSSLPVVHEGTPAGSTR
jgi:cytochrome P450